MIFNMTSGAGLALNVVAYSSAPTGTAPENTVAIVTSTPITGYTISSTTPSVTTNGYVYIQTGITATAPINISPTEQVYLYPLRAYQRQNGSWVSVSAYTYSNGSWVNWNTYFYATGSGALVPLTVLKNSSVSASSVSIRSDYIYMLVNSAVGYAGVGVRTTSTVNMSLYSQIVFDVYMTSASNGTLYCGVDTRVLDETGTPTVRVAATKGTRGLVTVNTSGLSGNYYIYAINSGDFQKQIYIYNIYGIRR